ncbi:hypothetical protein NDU88_002516 [Pleurodeles waltl]|uniref:Reverse transcriptase n=1 Tax=Pleurodeles waltl TaxID=8319 RepID=A0AAV7TM04_PLEWA|nr:hypothetical protein NDU88_002516 [Pleurodeles waltl]
MLAGSCDYKACEDEMKAVEIATRIESSPYTLLSERKWKECFGHIELRKSHIRPVGYGGKPVEVLGESEVDFGFQGNIAKGSTWVDGFPDVFKEGIGMFKGFVHRIKLADNAVPKVHKVRYVPLALRAEWKKELDRLCEQHIIEKIEVSDWVAPIVIARKANGSIRMCVDLRDLNAPI